MPTACTLLLRPTWRWSMRQLGAIAEGKLALKRKKTVLVGAVYDIATGVVHFLG